jgi:hypothetical protein
LLKYRVGKHTHLNIQLKTLRHFCFQFFMRVVLNSKRAGSVHMYICTVEKLAKN